MKIRKIENLTPDEVDVAQRNSLPKPVKKTAQAERVYQDFLTRNGLGHRGYVLADGKLTDVFTAFTWYVARFEPQLIQR